MNAEFQPTTVTILAQYREDAVKLLDKLVRKAKRYGNPDISYAVGEVYSQTVERFCPMTSRVKKVKGPDKLDITVIGEAPRVGPFEFLAKVEHGTNGNLVDIIPGRTVDPRFRRTPSTCEHCNTNRRRNETFVVRNTKTGAEVQVGRSCLADYTSHATPEGLLNRFSFLREFAAMDEEWGAHAGRWDDSYLVSEVLAATSVVIRVFGWCSKAQAEMNSELDATSSIVASFLNPPIRTKHNGYVFERNEKLRAAVRAPDDLDYAQTVLDWAVGGGAGSGDYGHNLQVICQREVAEGKRLGLVCSAVQAYERAMERAVRLTKERENAKASCWVGAEKQRLRDVAVTQIDSRVISSNQWSELILVKFRDDLGNVFTWFTGQGTGLQNGERASLTGTVKRHTEYNGSKETQLSRCTLKTEN